MFYYELFWPLCNLIHVSTISKLLWTLIFKPLSLDEPVGQHWSLSFFQNVLLENIRNSDSLRGDDGRELSCDLPAPLCSPSQKYLALGVVSSLAVGVSLAISESRMLSLPLYLKTPGFSLMLCITFLKTWGMGSLFSQISVSPNRRWSQRAPYLPTELFQVEPTSPSPRNSPLWHRNPAVTTPRH